MDASDGDDEESDEYTPDSSNESSEDEDEVDQRCPVVVKKRCHLCDYSGLPHNLRRHCEQVHKVFKTFPFRCGKCGKGTKSATH